MVNYFIQRPKWIVIVVGLLFFWLAQGEWLTESNLWQKSEGMLIDLRYQARGQEPPNPNIQIIGLNTSSFQLDTLSPEEIAASPALQKMQQPWPWDRSIYAAILEKLVHAGAKVVMFDLVLPSETEGDHVFAQALAKYQDHVVIGEMFTDEQGVLSGQDDSISTTLTGPNARLLLPGTKSVAGLVNFWSDPADQVERRMRYRTSVLREAAEKPGINPLIVNNIRRQLSAGEIPDDLPHITTLAAEKFQGRIVTPPSDNTVFVHFQGPGGTYRAWPVENMFVDALWQKPPFRDGLGVSNKIVIVGPMAESFKDVHPTPFGNVPGPEIQAQILSTLLRGQWMKEPSPAANFCIALGAMGLAILICLGIPHAWIKAGVLVGAVGAFFLASQLVFTHANTVVAMMPPLFCLLSTGSFGIVFEYSLEQFERRRYRNILDRYVSKNVAKTILEDRRSFVESLKGRKQPVTVLFSDIRGFTTMTESADADKLVAQLNEYFRDMVGSVLQNEGTLQKFIGDAIMAVWGDTLTKGIAVDAHGAVTTALQMRAALAQLNLTWRDHPDRIKLSIGIGINHGEVIVGNIGSPQRMEFTVLGDGVNLAARLESSTKKFHTDILVGEQAEKLTREAFVYRSVDLLTFVGKTKPIEVFAPLSDRSVPPPAWLATYHEAIQLYRVRKFTEAGARFQQTRTQIGAEDFLCDMYLSRCAAYQLSPPPEQWDGSFTLTEK